MGLKAARKRGERAILGVLTALVMVGCSLQEGGDAVTAQPSPTESANDAPRYIVPESTAIEAAAESLDLEIDSSAWRIQPPFYAAGREPDWRLDISDGWFLFQRSGLAEIEAPITPPDQEGDEDVFLSDVLTVAIKPGGCDLESVGARATGAAQVVFDNITYDGCVYAGNSPAATDAAPVTVDWSRELAARLIEVDACLREFEKDYGQDAADAIVVATYPRHGDTLGVSIVSRNDQRYECGAKVSGEVVFLEPVNPAQTAQLVEVRGRFYRTDNGPPPEACLETATDVMLKGGTVGYLLSDECSF